MQLLKALLPLLASSGLVTGASIQSRALTAAQMVANINTITTLSQKLQPIASSVQTGETAIAKRQTNPFNAVIDGFNGIIKTANADITNMDGTKPYGSADAQKVCTAFHNFVVVHQELLKIVIGKSGILEGIFLGPVASVLRSLESTVDTLAFGIIDSAPFCEASSTKDKENLDTTLGQAVCAYTPGGSLGVDLFC